MYYAIGDIHGEISCLRRLYDEIQQHIKETDDPMGACIIFLGDYIDRGENSKEVLDFLMALRDDENVKHRFLMGNHEELMIMARELNFGSSHIWLSNGGQKTLHDFNITLDDVQKGALDKYITWIQYNCVNYISTPDYVFVHGGLDTRKNLEETKTEVFLWKRTYGPEYENYDKIVIHGHTPQESGLPEQTKNEINVDTGSFFTKVVTAVILPMVLDADGQPEMFPFLSTLPQPKIYN